MKEVLAALLLTVVCSMSALAQQRPPDDMTRIGINEQEFQEMADLLKETLEDFDYDDSDIAAIQSEILSRKRFIVARRVA